MFFPHSHKDSKIEEFFKLEQKNMSLSEYEKKLSELVRLVPYIQADEVLKCKRFLSGLQPCIRVYRKVKGVYQALSNRALVSTVERKARVKVTEAEVQVEELSLVRDQ